MSRTVMWMIDHRHSSFTHTRTDMVLSQRILGPKVQHEHFGLLLLFLFLMFKISFIIIKELLSPPLLAVLKSHDAVKVMKEKGLNTYS